MPTVRLSDSTSYILTKFEHVRGGGVNLNKFEHAQADQ